jgi:hypothetical protein
MFSLSALALIAWIVLLIWPNLWQRLTGTI